MKKIKKSTKLPRHILDHLIVKLFRRNPNKIRNVKQVFEKLDVKNSLEQIEERLEYLSSKRRIQSLGDKSYKLSKKTTSSQHKQGKLHTGVVDMTKNGSAFIVCEGLEKDIFVSPRHISDAMNGDTVSVRVLNNRKDRRPEGIIEEVIIRQTEHFLGKYYENESTPWIMPVNNNVLAKITIDVENSLKAEEGEMVVVKITDWTNNRHQKPVGIITTVLGKLSSNDLEMNRILVDKGFNLSFPDEVIAESEALSEEISEEEVSKRRDMRNVLTMTIDPDTAKDFDDAISFQQLDNGNLEIGVHIADVAHYVKPGSELDKEAYLRATSVYLVDRVIPMLPERLSNGLCSLRPNEDKCVFSTVFEINPDFEILNTWIGRALIHSDKRFAYEEAQDSIENKDAEYHEELTIINSFSHHLRKLRFQEGSIGFETDEVKFELDEDKKPIRVYIKERKDAHLLIEDLMLLANKAVAQFIQHKAEGHEIPFVYRIHDLPDAEKVVGLINFAKQFDIQMKNRNPDELRASYNNLAKAAQKDEQIKFLEGIAIRSMAKAVYSTDNIGHFGLGFKDYSHFTSPIRRYADVLAHRILFENLGDNIQRVNKTDLELKCRHISKMERKAMESERESTRFKQVEFLEDKVGETFEGIISGIIDRGVFVLLKENHCEGMFSFDQFRESFEVQNGRLSAKGAKTGLKFKMGDSINVSISNVDIDKKQVTLEYLDHI